MDPNTKYHVINSLIAGLLVLLGSITGSGFKFTAEGFVLALATAGIVALTKFSNWYDLQDPCKSKKASIKLFNFVGGC